MTLRDSQLRHFNGIKKADNSYRNTHRNKILLFIKHHPGLQTNEINTGMNRGTGNPRNITGGQLQGMKSEGSIEMKRGGWYIVA